MKAKLTDVFIQKQKVAEGQRLEIFDQQVPGFGVRIGARERAFFFIRRVDGRKVRMSLGVYPVISLASARSKALSILHRIKAGEDPTVELKRRRPGGSADTDNTFSAVADRFLNQYCRGKKTPLRERTVTEYERHLKGALVSTWKRRPIDKITDKDVIAAIDQLEAAGMFATARLFKAYLRKFFGWCVEKRLIQSNPALNAPLASRPADFVRERVLSVPELRIVLKAANRLDAPYRAFVNVLALCGQRRHETSIMRWADLELEADNAVWYIPAEVTKNRRAHDVPLSPEVRDIIRSVPRIVSTHERDGGTVGGQLSAHVFSGDGRNPVSGFSKIKARLDRLIEEDRLANRPEDPPMAHWTWHDLRRSAATGMADMGVAPHVIEAILNHVSGSKAGVAGIYNRGRYDDERRRALAAWSGLLANNTDTSNIVPLVRSRQQV